jgi:hypothetical protein
MVEPVLEQIGQRSRAETDLTPNAAVREKAGLGPDTAPVKFLDQGAQRAKLSL